MAGRLSRRPRARSARWRLGLLALLVLAVLLLHLGLVLSVQRLHEGWRAVEAMPPRLQVAYVREMKASRPRPPAAAPARQAAPQDQSQPPADARPAPAQAQAPEPAASEPEPPAPLPTAPATVSAASAAPVELAASTAQASSAPPASALAAAPASDAAADEPGPEWPLSTRLNYKLSGNYRGEVHGHAQVEWIRQGRHYQVHLDVLVGPGFAPLIARRMSSDGELGARGIAPRRYDEDTRVMFSQRRRVSVLFEADRLTLANGTVEPAPPGVQDTASQFVQLTWLFLTGREQLRPGASVTLPLALPRRQYRWRYEVLG
ncbi:MAG: DUF3108 domain-containing protein, partial [Burkholderiaceae bacterium]